jgi:RNA polymerase sigma factor (sigma-70 family)
MSALRRMRATDAEINFKPWIYQIARNAAIDSYRRNSHAVEVSMDADDGLRASDRHRLVGIDGGPDAALVTKERLNHLQGAFDELSDVHSRVLVMRELEGMSYREIGQKLDLTRPAVESALFRARRRLESEYAELSEGRRCEAMRATITRMAAGKRRGTEEARLARHLKRCASCRRNASELGVQPLTTLGTLRQKAAAFLPLPWLFRRAGEDGGGFMNLFSTGANAAPLTERAVALVAAAAMVGAGGAALGGGAFTGDRATAGEDRPAAEHSAGVRGESLRGAAGHATNGERAGARRTSGRIGAGPVGGRAGDSEGKTESLGAATPGAAAPAAGPTAEGSTATGGTTALPRVDAPTPPQAPSPPNTEIKLTTPEISTPDSTSLPLPKLPAVEVELQLPDTKSVTDGLENVLP